MTLRQLLAALATVDPAVLDREIVMPVYVKGPGRTPPQLLIGGKEKTKPSDTKFKRSPPETWALVRALAKDKKPAAIAREVQLHRVTVSRYLSQEVKANRMAKSVLGLVEVPGAYPLDPKPVNEVKP